MSTPDDQASRSRRGHPSPHLGAVAIVYVILFNAGLLAVTAFGSGPRFPAPWEPTKAIITYFQTQALAVLICVFLQIGASVTLGIFAASVVSRLQFFGVRAAGVYIALFGGLATVFNGMAAAFVMWVMVSPGVAQDAALMRALYSLSAAFGGVGFSVPMGLLLAGVSVTAGFRRLLPKWLVALGLLLALFGEFSSLTIVIPKAFFLIPLTRFPSFIWVIATGFMLPKAIPRRVT